MITVEETPGYSIQSFQNGLDGYDGTDDTRLRVDQPDRILGATTKLEIDGNPDFSSLIRWDLSSIPTESTVVLASITIHVLNTSSDEFSFYEVKRPWVEAEATFNRAAAGAAWEIAGAAGPSDLGAVEIAGIVRVEGQTEIGVLRLGVGQECGIRVPIMQTPVADLQTPAAGEAPAKR